MIPKLRKIHKIRHQIGEVVTPVCIIFLLQLGWTLLVMLLGGKHLSSGNKSSLALLASGITGVWVFLRLVRKDNIKLEKPHITKLDFFAVLLVSMIGELLIDVSQKLPQIAGVQQTESISDDMSVWAIVLSIVCSVVLNPVYEELAFRGMTIAALQKMTKNEKVIVIVQAALFGFAHLSLTQGLYAFLAGLLFGRKYMKDKNLVSCISMHIIFNITGYVMVLAIAIVKALN